VSWLLAAIYDASMRRTERACLSDWRRELLAPLGGSVLEIGAGTGASLPFYPRAIGRLVTTDPDRSMLARLSRSVSDRPPPVRPEIVRADSEHLPFEDASFDHVVSMLVLCSVADQARTLAEVRRVLRPRGTLVFLEHVAAEDRPHRLVWQRRCEPIWRRVAGNCHLTRRTDRAIEAAGFVIEQLTRESMRKALPVVRPTIRGFAAYTSPPGASTGNDENQRILLSNR
jgi:ubiquinone/menaquinone biosynthesis C-methylase UbiE